MSKIEEILDKFNINGENEFGGTDKGTNHSYVEVYEKFLEPILEKDGSLLEIGIRHGGSIVLWNELLKNCRIFGIDTQDTLYENIREYVKDYPKKITLEFRDAYCKETIDHIKFIYPRGFDIIIDDGPHTEESQLKCIELYLELLKDDGVLVIEDIQNFDSIKVFMENIPESKFFDYEPLVFDLRDNKNRYDDIIFAIKKKVKKPTNKIAIFYHVGQLGNWKRLFQEQINSLVVSGLYHICDFIHIGVNGDEILPVLLPKFKVEYNSNKILEADTLKSLYDFCINNKEHRVLYFHTKGATQENTSHILNVNKWRYYLEYFAFHRWKDCVTSLKEYDTSGAEYLFESGLINQDTGITEWEQNPHYSGNYWWANASYISTLDPNYLYRTDKGWDRYRSEFWIGTGNPNHCELYDTDIFDKYSDWGSLISPDYVKKEEFNEPLLLKKMKTEIDLVSMKNENKIKKMQEITTAWTDHVVFAQWLVNRINPKVIVDLGVDYGYSTFSFAIPQIGHVYGIDCFEGDCNSGIRNTLENVNESKKNLELYNITFIKGYFDEIAKVWDKPIDILHIDGFHTYESVKNDYETWSKFLNDDGIILLHDTMLDDENFGIKKFFEEIDLPKVNFTCSYGLGVISKNKEMIEEISKFFNLPLHVSKVKNEEFNEKEVVIHPNDYSKNENSNQISKKFNDYKQDDLFTNEKIEGNYYNQKKKNYKNFNSIKKYIN
jgi:predicted O-methyltransferase YrrM